MSMFDWIKSSYPLPEPFMGLNQTKDIEYGISGTMTFYHIDPAGYLWWGNYLGTHTLEIFDEDDPRYNPDFKWMNHEWVPTGEHGTWKVNPITKYIEIYPAEFSGPWEQWPRLKIHFKSGKLQDFEDVTGR